MTDLPPKRNPPRADRSDELRSDWENRLCGVLNELVSIQDDLLQLLSAGPKGELATRRQGTASDWARHDRLGQRLAACREPLNELLDADSCSDGMGAAGLPTAALKSWLRDQQDLLRLSRRLKLLLA